MTDNPRFVYVSDFARRPCGQIWFGEHTGVTGREPFTFNQHKLTPAEATMHINSLMVLYPPTNIPVSL